MSESKYKVQKTDEEWRELLTQEQFQVARQKGTRMRGQRRADLQQRGRYLSLRVLRNAAFQIGRKVRQRQRLAQLHLAG